MEEAFKIGQKTSKKRNDSAVQGTNDSSILSKISMCEMGYFDDDFLKCFASKLARRSPLVNRGYYIRMKMVEFILKEFLTFMSNSASKRTQVLSLGAGFDSSFFRLSKAGLLNDTLFIEIDFPDVVKRKISMIKSNEHLSSHCSDLTLINEVNSNIMYASKSTGYILIGADMRNTQLLNAFLKLIDNFSDSLPTLLLSEVVLTYMAVNSGNTVLKWINETFSNCVLAIYEQINPIDPFGQVMMAHFKKLGSPLKCISKYPSEYHQMKRHLDKGFDNCFSIKAIDFYLNNISTEERIRIEKLEQFDEYEQWHLKCCHYSFVFATNGVACREFVEASLSTNGIANKSSSQIDLDAKLDEYDCPLALEAADRASLIRLTRFDNVYRYGVRMGHSLCMLRHRNVALVLGGFGEALDDLSGKHKRVGNCELLDLVDKSARVVSVIGDDLVADRVFQTCTVVNNETGSTVDTIFVLFGRSNPIRVFDSIVRLYVEEEKEEEANETRRLCVRCSRVPIDVAVSSRLARFRHGTCFVESTNSLFFYGGKQLDSNGVNSRIVNDAYQLNIHTNQLTPINSDICMARHSHAMCTWKNNVIISGGLSADEHCLSDLILVDATSLEMKKTHTTG